MIKIGITGTIGSGKSTITSYLRDRGIPIVDADIISRYIYSKYPVLLTKISNIFGSEFINNNNLDRKKMAKLIFYNKEMRVLFEGIVLPYIKLEIKNEFEVIEKAEKKICVLDAPTLIENDLHVFMNYNILIYCDEEMQIERVMKRDNISREDVIRRMTSQLSVEEKLKKVQFAINNSFSKERAYYEVSKIFRGVGVKI